MAEGLGEKLLLGGGCLLFGAAAAAGYSLITPGISSEELDAKKVEAVIAWDAYEGNSEDDSCEDGVLTAMAISGESDSLSDPSKVLFALTEACGADDSHLKQSEVAVELFQDYAETKEDYERAKDSQESRTASIITIGTVATALAGGVVFIFRKLDGGFIQF